jgi:hypothetical protein
LDRLGVRSVRAGWAACLDGAISLFEDVRRGLAGVERRTGIEISCVGA